MANLSFNIDANTTPAVDGVKRLGKSFEELGEDMLRIVDAGKRAGETNEQIASQIARAYDVPLDNARRGVDQLDSLLRQAGRTGSRASDDIEEGLEDVSRQARKTGDDVDGISSNSRGFGKLGEVGREVSQELGQNFGEAVSSIRGNFSDLGQVGQDTLGGLAASVAGFGPAGLIGALGLGAGAVIWGGFVAGQEEARKKQEEVNEAGARFAQAYADGLDGAISAASVFAEVNAIATDADRYKEAETNATNWGVSTTTAMRAMSGDALALAAAQDGLDRQIANGTGLNEQEQVLNGISGSMESVTREVQDGQAALDVLNGAMAQGAQQYRDAAQASYEYATANGLATGKTDDLGNAIVRLPDGKEVVVNAETQQAYSDIDAFEDRQIPAKEMVVRAVVDDSAVRFYYPPRKVGTVEYRAQTKWDVP